MTDTATPPLTELVDRIASGGDKPPIAIPIGWHQGRTAYGGLSTALALAAVKARWSDLPPLRSAQVAFIGPVAGDAEIRTELLRRGRTAAYIQADVYAGNALGVRIVFIFMHPQESHVDLAPPQLDPGALPPMQKPVSAPDIIRFAANFDIQSTGEEANGTAWISRWARLREREGLDTAVELMAIGDVLPPAAMRLFTRFGPISSMNWQINLLTPTPQTRDGWWLARARADAAQAGSSGQQMWIYNSDGALVATGTQSVALFV